MDISLEFPVRPGATFGLWPSAVAVTGHTYPPTSLNHQEALEFYRLNQEAHGILWLDTPTTAVYRIFPDDFRGSFAPDYRVTERGDYELVGLWTLPNHPPPPDDGGPEVPAEPGPFVGHPSGER